ncbi:ArsR/SmtB family transcription factor [Cellulosimicrobium composti]|nr:winged helix-turn-helix domain-containing protein [Cellulosimicrobium composti]
MPRLTRPPGMPREVEVAIELIGNRARAEVLRALALHDTLTIAELAELLDATRPAVHGHLKALEAQGLVDADIPAERRQGRRVHWRANRSEVEKVGTAFGDYIAGR